MKKQPYPDRIFNEFAWGGYLVWKLPAYKVFIDGRMDNFFINNTSFAQIYRTIINTEPGWETVLDTYEVNGILIPPYYSLSEKIRGSNKWKITYEDNDSMLAEKISPNNP